MDKEIEGGSIVSERRGSRIPCEIPAKLRSLDPAHPFSEPCLVILVNPRGCAARFGRSVEIGTLVQLEGLPTANGVIAHVVNSMCLGYG